MRLLGPALAVVIVLALAGLSTRHASSEPDLPGTFRVATFNIHKGADRRGHYDLEQTIDAIQRLDVDLIGVQEAMRNHPDFHCDDQPALIAEGLRRRTGRPWTYVHARAWITDNTQCAGRSRDPGVATEDLAFISASRIVSSSAVRLSEGRVGLGVRVEAMPAVAVVVTHLSANRQNQPDRIREIAALLPWTARHGPGILVGDFNAEPEADELGLVMARYRDAWAEAAATGRIGGVVSGSTRPGRRVSRVDYVLFEPNINLSLESVQIIDLSTLAGFDEVSDHHPVVATFRRPARP